MQNQRILICFYAHNNRMNASVIAAKHPLDLRHKRKSTRAGSICIITVPSATALGIAFGEMVCHESKAAATAVDLAADPAVKNLTHG
jgi:hypothetical protein